MDGQKVYRAIGLMSGTSLDGSIDVALIETDGGSYVEPLGFYAHPYDGDVREKVRACFGKTQRDAQVDEAETLVTDVHIEAVKASGFQADIIGFHGQTITHAPEQAFTWQLGDGERLARETGIDVVCDMRQADVKAGGQGAPLAPLYHRAILSAHDRPVAALNMGGVGNVTYIGLDRMLAFDTGPANALMDDYMVQHFGREFDEDGTIARSGNADKSVIEAFLALPYFSQQPPKSLDRNEFVDILAMLPDNHADAMTTLAALSVSGIVAGLKYFPRVPCAWYVCGGGRRNSYLMDMLAERLKPAPVLAIEDAGYDGDAIEAQAFAYLAVRSREGLPLSLPGTTGVAAPQTGGVYHKHDN